MSNLERIAQPRMDKLQRLRARGIDPYPARWTRSHTNAEAIVLLGQCEQHNDTSPVVNIAGRITANRGMGKINFMDIVDDSGKMQLYIIKSIELNLILSF